MEAVCWEAAQLSVSGNGSSIRNGEERCSDLVPDGGKGIHRSAFRETDGWKWACWESKHELLLRGIQALPQTSAPFLSRARLEANGLLKPCTALAWG